jgi:hypothetical protein
MTDVMTVGEYPDTPLPGPRQVVFDRGATYATSWPEVGDAWHRINRLPPSSPILERPYLLPGQGWKGTAGMPQHRYRGPAQPVLR